MKIRIGNDISIRWEIFRKTAEGQEPYPLDGDNCILYTLTPYKKEEVDGFSVNGNVITWTFKGKDQKHIGSYALELVQRKGDDGMLTVDTCKAFELVSHSCEITNEDGNGIIGNTHAGDVRRIRIGKDFDIRWSIYKSEDGTVTPYNLEDKDITLRILTPYRKVIVDGYSVYGNEVVWTFKGKDQRSTGIYALELVENDGHDGMMTVDTCRAFELVAHSCAETDESGGNIEINADAIVGSISVDTVELDSRIASETVNIHSGVAVAPYMQVILQYESNIEDKSLAMPQEVGGIAKGTEVSELEGRTYNEMFDALLFPTVNPTFTAPSASIALKDYASTQEVGADAPTEDNFTTGFNAGAINLIGVKQSNRAGALIADDSFIYYNDSDSADNTNLPAVVALGSTSYKYRAAYAAGPQPKNNKGGDYGSPLAAGSVDSSAVSVNGTYPWFASTNAATSENPVVKQSLVAWNATAGSMSTGNFVLQPSGTLPQVFKLPRQIKTLQMLNTVSNQMETIGLSDYNETTEVITIGGNEVTYYVYTYKGATRGSVTLLAKF